MLISMGGFTQKTIKNAMFGIAAASFVGMLAAFNEAQKIVSVPSVEDNFLNKPVTAIYQNPNQGFFKSIGIGLMLMSSASIYGGCSLARKEFLESKATLANPSSTAIAPRPSQPPATPRSAQPTVHSISEEIEWFDDPWESNTFQEVSDVQSNFSEFSDSEGEEWIFQKNEQMELDHPALDHKNWADQLALLIYGEQGGGKTSKLLWLAEEHIKRGNIVLIVSDFAYSGWVKGIEVAGVNGDFSAIAQALSAFCNEGEARRKHAGVYEDRGYFAHDLPTVVLIADEVTSWSEQPELEMVIFRLARLVLQDLRQTNMRVYLGGHGNTLSTLFGKALAGKKQTFDNQFTQVQCKAKHDKQIENGKRCAGEVVVSYFQGREPVARTVKIPSLLPSKECTKTVAYTTPKGEKGQKIVYDFSRYSSIPFSKYHAEENERRLKLKKEA